MIERDLANSSEWSRSSANIVMTWLHQIPTDGIDPRAWPIAYSYPGTYDPLGNGDFEFEGRIPDQRVRRGQVQQAQRPRESHMEFA